MFVVMWKMTDGPESVRVWLESLKAHLPAYKEEEKSSVSVVVVGTHADLINPPPLCIHPSLIDCHARTQCIQAMADQVGLLYPLSIHEISCQNLEGFKTLEEDLYTLSLNQPHMGEMIPESYVKVSHVLAQLKQEKTGNLPILKENPFCCLDRI